MEKGRLEAFSDAVIAIILTIMVLELKAPHGADWSSLRELWPVFSSYVLSFIYIGIYWNNHHHMLKAARHIGSNVLWPNLHLLFWLSLIPAVTAWMGERHFATVPMAVYGIVLLCSAIAYFILQSVILAKEGKDSAMAKALGADIKGKASPVLYIMGILGSFCQPWIGAAFYIFVALMWLIPDKRIQHLVEEENNG